LEEEKRFQFYTKALFPRALFVSLVS